MNKIVMAMLALLIFPGLSAPALADVTVSEKVKYFRISGKTGKQLHQQIRRRAPIDLRRKNWLAATYAHYSFKNLKIGVKNGKCVITSSNVHLSLTYHYPKWSRQKGSSRKLQKSWKAFSKGLIAHEKTHGRIFREMLQTIEREIKKIRGSAKDNCRRYTRSIKSKIVQIEKRYNRKHAAFDRRENQSRSKIRRIEVSLQKAK